MTETETTSLTSEVRRRLAKHAAEVNACGIRRLAVFGSGIHGDFAEGSDLDLLVEFLPGRTPGLTFFEIQEKLGNLLGRRVDLNTLGFLSPHFREEVAAEAQVVYEQT